MTTMRAPGMPRSKKFCLLSLERVFFSEQHQRRDLNVLKPVISVRSGFIPQSLKNPA
jgi:hypothetical protein